MRQISALWFLNDRFFMAEQHVALRKYTNWRITHKNKDKPKFQARTMSVILKFEAFAENRFTWNIIKSW